MSQTTTHIETRDHYTFGDTTTAADRLALLAATFEPSSARLLRPCAGLAPRLAVDLGCGPGHTTRLLHALLAPAVTLGIDRSDEHVARARATAPPGIAYLVHDIAAPPLPIERADFFYCRFLLTHLQDPRRALTTWAEAAAARAALVIEETADMLSPHPAFQQYYQLVGTLQAHYGQQLYIGRALDAALPGSGWGVEISAVRELSLPARRMARLHHMNLVTWKNDPFARATFAPALLAGLGAALEAIATGADEAPDVRHFMRQLVLMKR
jgi:trans-aconitate 2-methyltransferase